ACAEERRAALQWPADEIEARLHPNDNQRGALQQLQRATDDAVDLLSYVCRPNEAMTAPERLFAVDQRLDALHQAGNRGSAGLEDFYARLSDEQKAAFGAIGQRRIT